MTPIRRDLAIGLCLSALVFVCALAWGSPFVAAATGASAVQSQTAPPPSQSPSQPSPGQTQPAPDQTQPPQQTQPSSPDQQQPPSQTQPPPDQQQPPSQTQPPPDRAQPPSQEQPPTQGQPPSQGPGAPSTPPSGPPQQMMSANGFGGQQPGSQPSNQQNTAGTGPQSQTFTGTIVKKAGKYCLQDQSGQTYKLDDTEGARAYAGKSVKVTGQLDQQSMVIHVQNIQSAQT